MQISSMVTFNYCMQFPQNLQSAVISVSTGN